MADSDVGNLAVKISLDSTGFNTGLTSINSSLKVAQSGFKAASAEMGGMGTSTDQLALKSSSLNTQIDLQKQKVALLSTAVADSAAKKGTDATATQNLQVKLNNANTTLANMQTELGKTNSALDTGTTKQGLFATAAAKIGPAVSAGLLAAGVAAGTFLKESIDAAGEAQGVQANLVQTLKSTGDASGMTAESLDKLAEGLQQTSTFSEDQVKSGEAMLLTFTNIGQKVFPQATQSMLDMAQKMGEDPTQAAKILGKALNDPTTGLTALTRVGITFTAQQKDQIKAMQATGDTAGAQGIIIDALNTKFGGQAAAAANTYDGAMKQMNNSILSVKESIGTALLPILSQMVDAIAKVIVPVADFCQNNPQLTAIVLSLVAVFATVKGGLGVFADVKSDLATIFPALGQAAAAFTTTAVAEDGAAVSADAVGVSMGIALLPVLAIVAGVVLLALGVYELIKNWSSVSAFFVTLWTDTKKIFSDAIAAISAFLEANWPLILAIITGPIGLMVLEIAEHWNQIKADADAAWNDIVAVVMDIVNDFVTDAEGILTDLSDDFATIWDGIKLIFTGALTAITSFLVIEWTSITTTVTTVWTALKTFFTTLWADITAALTTAWTAIKTFISTTCTAIGTGVTTAFNAILTFFKTLPTTLLTLGTEAFDGLKSGITSVLSTLGSVVSNGFSSAISYIKELPSEALQWGKDIINGIVSGIRSAASAVGTAVQGVAQDIRSFLHFSVPDTGPLTDYQSWMPDMMAGLAQGITNSKGLVTKAISGLSSNMSVGLQAAASSLATSSPALAGASGGGSVLITGNTFNVRNDQDITKVAQQLYKFQQGRKRGQGQ